MTFFDERLAISTTKPSRVQQDVQTRMPALMAPAWADLRAFLERLSSCLQPDLADPRSPFLLGLMRIDGRIVAEARLRCGPPRNLRVLGRTELATLLAAPKSAAGPYEPVVSGLLSAVLTSIEHGYGLLPNDRNRAVTLTGLVQTDAFRDQLISQGLSWKDPGVQPTHGEFTHRLQWCAAMLALNDRNAGLYFRQIGAHADAELFQSNDGVKYRFGLWDAIADRNRDRAIGPVPYMTASASDFRSPENLQAWLLDPRQRTGLPLRVLASFINRRTEERETTKSAQLADLIAMGATVDADIDGGIWDFWAKALFNGQRTAALSPDQKVTLANAWYRLRTLSNGQLANPIVALQPEDARTAPNVPGILRKAYLSLGLDPQAIARAALDAMRPNRPLPPLPRNI